MEEQKDCPSTSLSIIWDDPLMSMKYNIKNDKKKLCLSNIRPFGGDNIYLDHVNLYTLFHNQ